MLSLVPLSPLLAQETPSCKTQTKASTGETTITCDNQPVDVLKQPEQKIFHAVAALSRTGDDANALSLVTGSASAHFTKVDTATALIDGTRHKFKASYTNGEKQAGVTIEQVVVVVPPEQVDTIREANSFRIRLNEVVFDMSPTIAQLKRIREMPTTTDSSP